MGHRSTAVPNHCRALSAAVRQPCSSRALGLAGVCLILAAAGCTAIDSSTRQSGQIDKSESTSQTSPAGQSDENSRAPGLRAVTSAQATVAAAQPDSDSTPLPLSLERPLIEPLQAPLSVQEQMTLANKGAQIVDEELPPVVLMTSGAVENGVEIIPAPRAQTVTPQSESMAPTGSAIGAAADPDSDDDGIADNLDLCAGTTAGLAVSDRGCLIPVGTFDALGFEPERAVVTDTGRQLLDELALSLNSDSGGRVVVVTYPETDTDDAQMALLLAKRRTLAVVRYLIQQSVDSARIVPRALEQQDVITDEGSNRVSLVEFKTLAE